MWRVAIIGAGVTAFCIVLALVGSHIWGRHRRGATVVRLLVGVPTLAAYAYGALSVTVLGRTVKAARRAKLELFWSHRASLAVVDDGLSVTNAGLLAEILLNVILFVPLGALLPFLFPKLIERGKVVRGAFMVCLAVCECSLAIELIQWQFRLGLFEFDDVLDNTLGAALGYAIYWLVLRRPWSLLRRMLGKGLPGVGRHARRD